MQFVKGMVVRSKAGHDKGQFFVVSDIRDNYIYIIDGKYKTALNPKKKNPLHLAPTSTVLNEQSLCTNTKICEILDEFYERLQ